jgi:hypothetical protein
MKVYFTLITILVFYSTAFAMHPYINENEPMARMIKRSPASGGSYSCQEALTAFVQRMKPFNYVGKYKSWHEFEAADLFLSKKTELLKAIEYWQDWGKRSMSMSQLKNIGISSSLEESLRIDKPEKTVDYLLPLFFETEQAYFLTEKRMEIRDDLLRLLSILRSEGDTPAAQLSRETIEKKFGVEFAGWNTLKLMDDKMALVEKFLSKMTDKITETVAQLNSRIEEYEVAKSILLKIASDKNNPQSKDALIILEKLETKNTLDSYGIKIGQENLATPSIDDLYKMVNRNPVGELISIDKMRRLERWTALISRLPDGAIFQVIDFIISKIPRLNRPEIRSFVRSVVDNKKRLVFYPNIDRILSSKGTMKNRLTSLVDMNTSAPGDELLIIFARRTDAYQTWKDLLEAAKVNSESLVESGKKDDFYVTFYDRMLKADAEAKKLGELPPWHVPRQAAMLRTLVDGVLIIGIPYGSYELIRWIWGDDKMLADLLKEKNEWDREKKILENKLSDDEEKMIDTELDKIKK